MNYFASGPHVNPKLSRFDPFERILYFDDFDNGMGGWTAHIGNYEGSLDTMLSPYSDLRPAMLSNLTMWDVGTVGAMDGTYALKLATRPEHGHMALLIKRHTWRALGNIRLECYLTYKPEASEMALGELDVRAFGVGLDLQDDEARWMPQYRFLNALGGLSAAGASTHQGSLGKPVGKWQQRTETGTITDIGGSGKTVSHWHLSSDKWTDIPDGGQELCYNEIPTKMNWVYLAVDVDLRSRTVTQLRCNDKIVNGPLQYVQLPAMPNLRGMLNTFFWVETDSDKRAFLYLDSVVLSARWDA